MPEIANSSFYLVQTDDNGKTSSAAGGDDTQFVSDDASNVTEPKTYDNESFYFVDDKSVSINADVEDPTPAASQLPADTESAEEQHRQDEESEDKETETTVEVTAIEMPPPVTSTSHYDPDNLLTSVRLVIGALIHRVSCRVFI